MTPAERIEAAIVAARAVAASPGAEELRKRSEGTAGTWTKDDESRLRAGWIQVWNPHLKRYDRLDINPGGRL